LITAIICGLLLSASVSARGGNGVDGVPQRVAANKDAAATDAKSKASRAARKARAPSHRATATPTPSATSASPLRVLDRLDEVGAWKTITSEGVSAALQPVVEEKRPALRMAFDLGGTAGYAIARRPLSIELPENYAFTFWLRADAPANDLQIKLIDASGDNVWWYHRANFTFPREWQQITIKKRQIDFAWGPTKDRTLRRVAAIEIVVAAGAGGGRGAIFVSDLALQELPQPPASWPTPRATRGHCGEATRSRAANSGSRWISAHGANSAACACALHPVNRRRATTCSSRRTTSTGARCAASTMAGRVSRR
jgi:hypothetical protein